MQILPGDYIAGFVDGEGCFALKFRRDVRYDRPKCPVYFYWDIEFAIMLRQDDREILERIQTTLSCGRISINKNGGARYAVNDLRDLIEKVVPFFERHQLHAKKKNDFLLWKQALEILIRRRQRRLTNEKYFSKAQLRECDLDMLKSICVAMKNFKSRVKPWKWLLPVGENVAKEGA